MVWCDVPLYLGCGGWYGLPSFTEGWVIFRSKPLVVICYFNSNDVNWIIELDLRLWCVGAINLINAG